MKKRQIINKNQSKMVFLVTGVLFVGIVGAVALFSSSAATPTFANFEAEAGSEAGGAAAAADTTASDGQYVKFAATASGGGQAGNCTVTALLENPCRPWVGAWANDYGVSGLKNQILDHESRIGRQVDIAHSYNPVGNNSLSSDQKFFINRANTYLYANWKPTNPWSRGDGSNASVNAGIDAMADSVKSVAPKKIFLSVFHEPENDVTGGAEGCGTGFAYKGSENSNSGTPAEYRAMWRNVRNRFDAKGVNNVVWVMNYMGFSKWNCMIDDLWPGNDLIDWVTWDPYGGNTTTSYTRSVDELYNHLMSTSNDTYNYKSKIWGFGEFGIWDNQSPANASKYYDDLLAGVKTGKYSRIKAYIVFDAVGINDSRIRYNSNGNDPNEQAKYASIVKDPVFTVGTTPSAPSNYGTVSGSFNATTAGNYKVWSRIMAPDTTNNAFQLSLNNGAPLTMGDTAITANTWTWVAHSTAQNLSAGSHPYTLTGSEPNVKVDRVLFLADQNCVPTGNGDNCTQSTNDTDTTAPTVSITSPAQNATVNGTVNVAISAADNTAITGLSIRLDGAWLADDNTAPYNYSLNTTTLSNGVHTLVVRAYDAAGNMGESQTLTVNVNNTAVQPKKGDLSGDGKINIQDMSILLGRWGTNNAAADLNVNGTVDLGDLSVLLSNWTG